MCQAAVRRTAASAVAAAAVVSASTTSAQIHEVSERLAAAWREAGAAVVIEKALFLSDDNDEERPVVIALTAATDQECTTVAVLGARGLGFHVRVVGSAADGDRTRLPSVAGAVSIERCGSSAPRRLVIASDSGRGAIEAVVARSAQPVPSLDAVLPERSGGGLMTLWEPGALPPLGAPEKRAALAEKRATRDGATIAPRVMWLASADGTGAGEHTLDPGCHVLQLFATDPRARQPTLQGKLDLDAEMRGGSDGRVLARDRTDAPDAQLSTCVGESTGVTVVFAGAPPGTSVLVGHAVWPLPDHLPLLWGSDARARLAHVLLARHVVSLPHEPAALAQGGSGLTPVPLAIQPGACYLGIAVLVQSSSRAVGLRVRVGAGDFVDDRGVEGDGAVVAFCAGDTTHALAVVEARGNPLLGWGFALYRLQSGVWGISR
ncbi:MAG: hypothetical protein M3O36_04490 [Myxococcota bacterium]|nr:hypothetical protein [Myxococcota bacterium]